MFFTKLDTKLAFVLQEIGDTGRTVKRTDGRGAMLNVTPREGHIIGTFTPSLSLLCRYLKIHVS